MRVFDVDTYNETKISSEEVCRKVMNYYCPELTEIPTVVERYKEGDIEFSDASGNKLMVEMEMRDSEKLGNWKNVITGVYETLHIPYRKRTSITGYTYYIAINDKNIDEFAFVNVKDIQGVEIIEKKVKGKKELFLDVPSANVFYGRFAGNHVDPIKVARRKFSSELKSWKSRSEPNLHR